MIEVELKARISDPEAVAARVDSFARPDGPFLKEDAYWHGPDWRLQRGAKGFRIRREEGKATVTWKSKRCEGGMEINREREFGVDDPEAFGELILRLGCEPFYAKRKSGRRWFLDRGGARPLTIEVLEVAGLGHFIEIEALLEEEEPVAVALARGEILSCLARAGLGEGALEPRTYAELLTEAGLAGRV